MIGPKYILSDPLEGFYSYQWRSAPSGPDPDPSQSWNAAGLIHWNDWRPTTGENAFGAVLAPLQVLFMCTCLHIPRFSSFNDAPPEVQLAISITRLFRLGHLYFAYRFITDHYPARVKPLYSGGSCVVSIDGCFSLVGVVGTEKSGWGFSSIIGLSTLCLYIVIISSGNVTV
jgi:hypothetical protein